jgi:hypothetical protein
MCSHIISWRHMEDWRLPSTHSQTWH